MSNPTAAVIAMLLRAGEDNPRAYIAAVLDNMPRAEMAKARHAQFRKRSLGTPSWSELDQCYRDEYLADEDAALSTARATLLPGDAT